MRMTGDSLFHSPSCLVIYRGGGGIYSNSYIHAYFVQYSRMLRLLGGCVSKARPRVKSRFGDAGQGHEQWLGTVTSVRSLRD